MRTRPLGNTGIEIGPLVFGGNVFGWTVDERTSFALLDRFVELGLNAIDTADCYFAFAPGNVGGESETIIGNWLARSPGRREQVVIVTKVGYAYGPHPQSLSKQRIAEAIEDSLQRLRTDYVDVYLSHLPDSATPIEETFAAYDSLVKSGKVRAIGASNYSAMQLGAALDAARSGLPRYAVVEPEYNLYDRSGFEGELRDLCVREGLGVIPYFSLASGFLTGKYRTVEQLEGRSRARLLGKYFDARGVRILAALDTVASARGVPQASVALAWLMHREGVTAPIASATSVEQLDVLARATTLSLTPAEMDLLTGAGVT